MNYEHDFCHCEQSESIQSMYKQLKFKKDAGLLRFARNDKNSVQRLIYATTLRHQKHCAIRTRLLSTDNCLVGYVALIFNPLTSSDSTK